MKWILKTGLTVVLLAYLLTIAFNSGKKAGFKNGSQWAMLQAQIVAREAGIVLPIYLYDGAFRVVFKQPPGLYRKAWRLADKFDRNKQRTDSEREDASVGSEL